CFFFQAEDGIRDYKVTGVQTCALPICPDPRRAAAVSGAEASRPRRRADRVPGREPRPPPTELSEGSVRSLHRVVREVSESGGDENLLTVRAAPMLFPGVQRHLPKSPLRKRDDAVRAELTHL